MLLCQRCNASPVDATLVLQGPFSDSQNAGRPIEYTAQHEAWRKIIGKSKEIHRKIIGNHRTFKGTFWLLLLLLLFVLAFFVNYQLFIGLDWLANSLELLLIIFG